MNTYMLHLLGILLLTKCLHCEPNIGYFWHITDMHWDPTYSSDEKALSCNTGAPPSGYGKYGHFFCDPPMALINSSVRAMKAIFPDPDFLVWTGDDTPHIYNDTILHQEAVLSIIGNLTNQLTNTFPDKIVYSALGNHDWSPKSQLAPHNHVMYDRIADMWSSWLNAENAETFKKGGYYVVESSGPFRVLVLNTNLYYTSNKLTANMADPAGQWAWLETQLENATQINQKVMIVSHVPPGTFEKHRTKYWFYPNFNQKFLQVIRKYATIISAMHFGHHHTDSFKLVYDSNGAPVSSMLLAPAVTPWETTLPGVIGGKGNNPAIRLIKYDKNSGQTLDIAQYYLNLTQANSVQQAEWKLLYNATQYYGLTDMGTQSLHVLAESFLTDGEKFHKYYQANGVLYDPQETCVEECQFVQYCAVTRVDYEEYEQCVQDKMKETSAAVELSSSVFHCIVLALFTCFKHSVF